MPLASYKFYEFTFFIIYFGYLCSFTSLIYFGYFTSLFYFGYFFCFWCTLLFECCFCGIGGVCGMIVYISGSIGMYDY